MNLTNFLKQTDALTSQYSTDELIAFIHDIARVCPEHRREDFLEMLKSAGEQAENVADENVKNNADFDEMYSHIRDDLKNIDSQEITVTAVWNEEYDDWYDDSGEEFYYEDNSGISDMLKEACDFVHICMDTERYKEGFAVGKQLLEKRTAGIMDANRRNYYGECAAYIAALGEVRESVGEIGAKQKLMTSYKEAYPRRSAFRDEMRKYGWIDTRKK